MTSSTPQRPFLDKVSWYYENDYKGSLSQTLISYTKEYALPGFVAGLLIGVPKGFHEGGVRYSLETFHYPLHSRWDHYNFFRNQNYARLLSGILQGAKRAATLSFFCVTFALMERGCAAYYMYLSKTYPHASFPVTTFLGPDYEDSFREIIVPDTMKKAPREHAAKFYESIYTVTPVMVFVGAMYGWFAAPNNTYIDYTKRKVVNPIFRLKLGSMGRSMAIASGLAVGAAVLSESLVYGHHHYWETLSQKYKSLFD